MGSVLFALGICSGLLYLGYWVFRHSPNQTNDEVNKEKAWYQITDDQRN